MRPAPRALCFAFFLSAAFLPAECVNDYRSNKKAGIISDFTLQALRQSVQPNLRASPAISSAHASMRTRNSWRSDFEPHFRIADALP